MFNWWLPHKWPVQQTDSHINAPISVPRHSWVQRSSRNISHSEATNNNTKADCKSKEVRCLDRIGPETGHREWLAHSLVTASVTNMHPSPRVQGTAVASHAWIQWGQFVLSNARQVWTHMKLCITDAKVLMVLWFERQSGDLPWWC